MEIQILHIRDSDEGCDITVFIDGAQVKNPVAWVVGDIDFTCENIDAGRGWTTAEWNARIASMRAMVAIDPSDFNVAHLEALESYSNSPYITD